MAAQIQGAPTMVHESEMFVHGQFVDIVCDSPEVTDDNIRQL